MSRRCCRCAPQNAATAAAGGRTAAEAGPAASLSEQLDAVAEIDPAALVAAIAAADRAGHAASPWQPVAADPARWLRHYVQAVRRA